MVDVHWSFRSAEVNEGWYCNPAIDELPATQALLKACMAELPPLAAHWGDECDPLRRDWLNVIVRRYGPGHRLKWHKDSIGMFDDPVYGVVLNAASSSADLGGCLEFKHGGEHFALSEFPGAVHLQTGPSRFEWAHGVPVAGSGGRVTVTWRWFRPSHVRWSLQESARDSTNCPGRSSPLPPHVRDLWVNSFICSMAAAGVGDNVADGFLLGIDEQRDSSIPWLFQSKNEVCGPQLSVEKHWPYRRDAALLADGPTKKMTVTACASVEAAVVRAQLAAEARERRGLDVRVLPLLRLWEAVEPGPEEIAALADAMPEAPKEDEEDDLPEDDLQDEESMSAMAAMGLPVTFAGPPQKKAKVHSKG
eukprot:gnl/TRDRNA2_/TRDRNA2_170634_c0_seq1.p1 gnl/TRDRNA2_/TRDRNA2_170634_c0~~gnl/TRDRNA2_/TRDRNA2_170634_c0_seq1.p1  ORF type:complete len:410 (-),score=84.92 gnl/TRDRNA2_/TRDRNA2_170634_c0_seq1:457-1545(-)